MQAAAVLPADNACAGGGAGSEPTWSLAPSHTDMTIYLRMSSTVLPCTY